MSRYGDASQMKSPIADMKNTGPRYGGAITAALFLRQFVDTDKVSRFTLTMLQRACFLHVRHAFACAEAVNSMVKRV